MDNSSTVDEIKSFGKLNYLTQAEAEVQTVLFLDKRLQVML